MPPTAPRLLYAAGPGDVIGTYRHWEDGRDDPSQVAVTYSAQFYDLCRSLGASGYVISSHKRVERVIDGDLTIEHRPVPFVRGPGPLYHLGQVWYGLRLVASAVRFGADVAVVAEGTHPFVLGLLPTFGVAAVPTLHCVLWPKNRPPTGFVGRTIWKLNRWFYRRRAACVLSLSDDVTQQVRSLSADVPVEPFLPTYRPGSFGPHGYGPPPVPPPFRVFFAGRIERNKGVFDLLDVAVRFANEGRTDVEFDLCGDGGQLPTLRAAAAAAGVAGQFRCHGHTTKPTMRQMYERCHVVVVPTTTAFVEGFNKVVAEGVLAGRPVITSSVCPALEYVRAAVVEVTADDPSAYGDAILRLRDDADLYSRKRAACDAVRSPFYDPACGWAAALERACDRVLSNPLATAKR